MVLFVPVCNFPLHPFHLEPTARGVSDLRVFLLFPLIFHFNTLSILNFISKKMPNSLNLSRAEKQPETRTRSHQTSTVQRAGLVHPVDNPEHILQKKARVVAKRRRVSSEMLELSDWPTLSLGSPSDVEPNPFLDTSAERTRPIYCKGILLGQCLVT